MSKIPVLLLISTAINLNALHLSPRWQRYHFFALTALDYLGNGPSRSGAGTLLNALEQEIGRVEAQYLLAHLGLAFDRYPVEFLTTLLEIQRLYPRLQIGFDKGLHYAMQVLQVSTAPGPQVKRLAARLARVRAAFDRDEETRELATCLY